VIGYDEALSIMLREARPLSSETCLSAQALGRILAAPVASPAALPPFDNSAMDGFALAAGARTLRAGSRFDVRGTQVAGDAHADAQHDVQAAWEITTGARVPDGFDTIVPVEQVERLEPDDSSMRIRLTADVAPAQHIRRRGEDVPMGAEVLRAGDCIEPQQLMLLAALGVTEVNVSCRPKVAILTTGRELVDAPGRPLASGEIRNSNGPFLAARLEAAGAQVVHRCTVGDEPDLFRVALADALAAGADIVVSTGAVSMGRHDFVPDTLRALDAELHFHKVRIRPGKPLLFARLAGGALFFGLPGNPVSCAVGLRFFVEPALRAMLGMAPEAPLKVPLAADFVARAPLRFHLKGRLDCDASGQLRARVLAGQESFRILPLLASNAWIVIPEANGTVPAGTIVDVHGLGHLQPPSPMPA
jgi:molybdopterin molybdotransferase